MDLATVESLFTQEDGRYAFARWGRPIVPVVFGVTEDSLPVIKGAIEGVVALSGHKMAETDPEFGANLMIFFLKDWDELRQLPDLDRFLTGGADLVDRLEAAAAHQYRAFRFDDRGMIKACFVFLRMDDEMLAMPAEGLALAQAAQSLLMWGGKAFAQRSPLAEAQGHVVLHPEIAAVIAAAYDPILPPVSNDPSHAMRLFARANLRLEVALGGQG